ncbi:hypothetical protein HRbin17_01135 [bacterium HR17]|uniref:Thiol-disulfide oxidoreductase ResA n=1 Tax=Candidatus Fervidibacter japonicus TaxID=2035412 RepID=A0A2H5XBQ0_9BACT|nr:hypothetical protein HRbin17_01135 [bacterium HR17]
MPHLAKWARRYGRQGLVVIGLSTASPEEQREAARRFGVNYLLLRWEPNRLPLSLRRITVTPTTLLIDRYGYIREVQVGLLFGERLREFERRLVALLKERATRTR